MYVYSVPESSIDHTLTFIYWLLIYLMLLTLAIMTQPLEQNSEAVAGGVFENFANFTGKHLCWSLFFTKLQAFRPATLLKKRLLHRCFLVKFEKFWRTAILKNTRERLLLCVDYFIIYWFWQFTTVHVFHFHK